MKLQDGKVVYLTHEAKRMFKARYEHCSPEQPVQFQTIGKHQAQFFIIQVCCIVTSWNCFDEDIHLAGAAITWCLKNVEKQTEPEQFCNDLHGKTPDLLIDQKLKKNEEEWIQN